MQCAGLFSSSPDNEAVLIDRGMLRYLFHDCHNGVMLYVPRRFVTPGALGVPVAEVI